MHRATCKPQAILTDSVHSLNNGLKELTLTADPEANVAAENRKDRQWLERHRERISQEFARHRADKGVGMLVCWEIEAYINQLDRTAESGMVVSQQWAQSLAGASSTVGMRALGPVSVRATSHAAEKAALSMPPQVAFHAPAHLREALKARLRTEGDVIFRYMTVQVMEASGYPATEIARVRAHCSQDDFMVSVLRADARDFCTMRMRNALSILKERADAVSDDQLLSFVRRAVDASTLRDASRGSA